MSELLRSFREAVDRLEEALKAPESDIVRDAAIQRFEFCFELAWKCLQRALRREGLDCRSPKACLNAAWSQGWLPDERPWLAMLDDRNLTSHTYDERLAREVFARLPGHLKALRDLLAQLD